MDPTIAGLVDWSEYEYFPYTARKAPLMSTSTPVAAEEFDDNADEKEVDEEEVEDEEAEEEEVEEQEAEEEAVKGRGRKTGAGIKTTPYEDRPEFGIPRLSVSKEEFIAIRPLGLYTTAAFNNVPMDGKKSMMLTNKEVTALTAYRASKGQMWTYVPRNECREKWMKVTDEKCSKYEVSLNEKVIRALANSTVQKPKTKRKRGGDDFEEGQNSRETRVRRA